MAKKITDENGNTYVQKKPFYKKVWFWILVIIIAGIAFGSMGGKKSSNGGEKVNSTSDSNKDNSSKSKFYKVGDSVKVDNVTYTLTGVSLTSERNQFDEKKPAEVVKVTYTVKNDSDSDIPVGTDVQVYGPDNKKAESYPNDNTMGSLSPGKEMDCTAHFGINSKGEIEILFSPIASFKEDAKFKATV